LEGQARPGPPRSTKAVRLERFKRWDMLTAFLAKSGGRVLFPSAVTVVSGQADDEVRFIDSGGKTLAVFRRADISLYTRDGASVTLNECDSKNKKGQAASQSELGGSPCDHRRS
jgi:hypothetical protein